MAFAIGRNYERKTVKINQHRNDYPEKGKKQRTIKMTRVITYELVNYGDKNHEQHKIIVGDNNGN